MADRMSVYDFGTALLQRGDLDPIYVLAYQAKKAGWLDGDAMRRWLLAYWCFYHMGTTSAILYAWEKDGAEDYWYLMRTAAASSIYPRGRERRHFRAKNAVESIADLSGRNWPTMWRLLLGERTAKGAMERAQKWRGFGPWIAFKAADMLERLGLVPLDFSGAGVMMYESPLEGAKALWTEERGDDPPPDPDVAAWALRRLLRFFSNWLAPPSFNRACGVQEAETILCKWKSYREGHYRIGEDIEGAKNALEAFLPNPVAERFLDAGEGGGLW